MTSRIRVGIAGTGSYLPERIVDNAYLDACDELAKTYAQYARFHTPLRPPIRKHAQCHRVSPLFMAMRPVKVPRPTTMAMKLHKDTMLSSTLPTLLALKVNKSCKANHVMNKPKALNTTANLVSLKVGGGIVLTPEYESCGVTYLKPAIPPKRLKGRTKRT